MTTSNVSKLERLAVAFATGAQLTARQIASRYRVANPYNMVYTLRNEGVEIERGSRVNSKGETIRFYQMARSKATKRKAA
jgi:hypothetical protein